MEIKWDQSDFRKEDIETAIDSLNTHIGAKGPYVEKLEKAFAEKVGAKYAIAVDNGTNALVACSMVLKHIYGDLTVGIPNFSFIASANAPRFVFDNIKFLDIDPDTWNIDPKQVEGVDALVVVDVGGLPVDYDKLKELNLPIIADSAESLGAKYKGEYIGTQAMMHTYSLHRSKVISCGEGGMITTNNKLFATLLKSFSNHGYDLGKEPWEYKHTSLGLNFRMSDVHAALAYSQLKRLDEYVEHRRNIASIYDKKLKGKVKLQKHDTETYYHNYFFYGVLVENRDRIVREMNSRDITVKTWSTIASQKCYGQEDPTVSELVANGIILLPIHNQLKPQEAEYVADTLLSLL